MTEYQSHSHADWLSAYPWEAFLTVRLPRNIHPTKARNPLVRDVLRPLCKFLATRVAAIIVVSFGHNKQERPHIHALLASKSGQLSSMITESANYLRSVRSDIVSHNDAVDIRPYLAEYHPQYVARHMAAYSEIDYFDRKLVHCLANH